MKKIMKKVPIQYFEWNQISNVLTAKSSDVNLGSYDKEFVMVGAKTTDPNGIAIEPTRVRFELMTVLDHCVIYEVTASWKSTFTRNSYPLIAKIMRYSP